MISSSRDAATRLLKSQVLDRYRSWALAREAPPWPTDAMVPLAEAEHVVLQTSGVADRLHHETYAAELAFALELAARGRSFAVTDDARAVFGKRLAWFVPGRFIRPELWDYSRQVHEFAVGLERQGNELFCSSAETRFWENKAYMHQRLDEAGVPVPPTAVLTRDNRAGHRFDAAPVLVKEEHSAGSSGLHHFSSADAAREFVMAYAFRPGESLIVQEVVPGATKDLRVTMVGDRIIPGATYWRIKTPELLASPRWTPTATTYGTQVLHGDVPDGLEDLMAGHLRDLGMRTAGADLMWPGDDVSGPPVMLELSPYYQPNPPKPERYEDWSYKRWKGRDHLKDGYLAGQFRVYREIAAEVLDQGLF